MKSIYSKTYLTPLVCAHSCDRVNVCGGFIISREITITIRLYLLPLSVHWVQSLLEPERLLKLYDTANIFWIFVCPVSIFLSKLRRILDKLNRGGISIHINNKEYIFVHCGSNPFLMYVLLNMSEKVFSFIILNIFFLSPYKCFLFPKFMREKIASKFLDFCLLMYFPSMLGSVKSGQIYIQ